MLYLLYIVIGFFIIIVDCAITAFWAIHDTLKNQEKDKLSFAAGFKKYFIKNNNLPIKLSDLFN